MAYIMGFFIADGYMSPGGSFTLCLHKKDIEILEFMNKAMNSTYSIKCYDKRPEYVWLVISSVEIANDLAGFGVLPNKRKTWNGVDFHMPEKFIPDLVRGFFDGDGWICIKANKYLCAGFANKSKRFLEQIRAFAKIKGGSLQDRKTWHQLEFSNKNSIKLKEFMYNGEFALKRKYKKFYDTVSV